jgi:hypothetical protein
MTGTYTMKDAPGLWVELGILTFALCRYTPAHTYVYTCSEATTAHCNRLFLSTCIAVKDVEAMNLSRSREAESNAESAARNDVGTSVTHQVAPLGIQCV